MKFLDVNSTDLDSLLLAIHENPRLATDVYTYPGTAAGYLCNSPEFAMRQTAPLSGFRRDIRLPLLALLETVRIGLLGSAILMLAIGEK